MINGMAYVNEFGQTINCTVSISEQVSNFLHSWYFTLLPLVLLVVVFFVLKKYSKNNLILITYVILAIVLCILWIPKMFLTCT